MAASRASFSTYYQLTKPRVTYGNILTGIGGFLLAAGHVKHFDAGLFVATIVGMTLVVGAACALNNVFDRDIDQLMTRTKNRAVASGQLSVRRATSFALVLGTTGMVILSLWTNWLVVSIGIIGFVVYVWLYGALSKRSSIHGTLVGSISGALPILAGYVSVSNQLDTAAALLFLMLFFWQFPEFYSIAIYRRQEYKAAGVPVMPVVKGVPVTVLQIFIYTALFVLSTLLLTPFGYTGWCYFILMGIVGLRWLQLGWQGLHSKDPDGWARRMFHFSMIVILVLTIGLALGPRLP